MASPELDPPPGRPQVPSEGNTVAAAGVLIYAVVLDALTSVPTAARADVPAALRTSAYVLVAFVAAPPVDGRDLFEQRTTATLLAPVFLGLHQAELHARLADGVFSALAGYALLSFYVFSGLKPGHRLCDRNGQRENVVALVGALPGVRRPAHRPRRLCARHRGGGVSLRARGVPNRGARARRRRRGRGVRPWRRARGVQRRPPSCSTTTRCTSSGPSRSARSRRSWRCSSS